MSQKVHVNTDTDVHCTGIPNLPQDELVKRFKDYLSSKKLKPKVVFVALVKLITPGEFILRLSSTTAVLKATDGKTKFIKVGEERKYFNAEPASADASYQANFVPPEFQAPADSSGGGPPNNKAHSAAASGSTATPGDPAQTIPIVPANTSSSGDGKTPSQPALAERPKPKPEVDSESTLFITVKSAKKTINGPILNMIFHQPGRNNQAPMTKPFVNDIAEPYEFENENPPRFKMKQLEKVHEAIKKYNGATVDKYGLLEIKEWFELLEPPVTVSASDAADVLKAAPRQKTTGVVTRMELGGPKFSAELANPKTFAGEIAPDQARSNEVIANYVQITAWPKHIYEYGIHIKDVALPDGFKGEKRTRRIGRLNEKKAIIETLSEHDPLKDKSWATDYDTLWVLQPLWAHTMPLEIFDAGKIQFYKNDGRTDEHAPQVELTYLRTLSLPDAAQNNAFVFEDGHDFRERIIQALNAFVSKHIGTDLQTNDAATGVLRVKQTAPNKFYAKDYFKELNAPTSGGGGQGGRGGNRGGGRGRGRGGDRGSGNNRFGDRGGNDARGNPSGGYNNQIEQQKPDFTKTFLFYRGFSTSIRPTTDRLLLGITPLNSAFLRPVTVHDWLDFLRKPDSGFRDDEIYKTLVGVRCRLLHKRVQHNPRDPDPNDERHRYKVITEFGKDLTGNDRQWFQPRMPPGATTYPPVQTVESCFTDLLKDNPDHRDTICVNVGAKLKYAAKDDDDKEKSSVLRTEDHSRYENLEKALWIPANLLEIEPMQLYSTLLSGTYQRNMVDYACNSPMSNRAWIEGPGFTSLGIQSNNTTQASWMRNLSLSIHGSLLRVRVARQDSPTILYGNKQLVAGNASWNLLQTSFCDAGEVPAVCFVRITGTYYGETRKGKTPWTTNEFADLLAGQFRLHGIQSDVSRDNKYEWLINVGPMHREDLVTNKIDTEFYDMGQAMLEGNPYCPVPGLPRDKDVLFIIILPKKDPASLFQTVKRAADQNGMHNICVLSEKVDGYKGQRLSIDGQYVSNLCLKVNAKLGKDVHRLAYFNDSAKTSDTIILGADIGAVKGGPNGCPAIASVVGSVNKEHMITPGSMRLIPAKQDNIPFEPMRDMVFERLKAWYDENKSLPANILMYRDGVSQSQYASLLEKSDGTYFDKPADLTENFKPYENEHKKKKKQRAAQNGEVEAIYQAYERAASELKVPDAKKPKLTFVIVGKRHNSRFFPAAREQATNNGNLQPGCFIETGCTLPNEWPVVDNFFLLSHAAIKGTGRPAHYVVLRDEMGLTNTVRRPGITPYKPVHTITHNLCFAYTRATKGVSYCAPAYHADRLCTRGQDHLKRILALVYKKSYWGKQPDPTPQDPAPAESWWYQQIVDGLARDELWNWDYGKTYNPWHRELDNGMFWI